MPRNDLYSASGVVIGKKGADIEKLRAELSKLSSSETVLNIVEIRKPEIDSTLVAENIAQQLERRVAFRRAMKRAMQTAQRMGALGIALMSLVVWWWRLRMEWYLEGRVPLHTLRADIDYGVATARTTYGAIGIKVWIFAARLAHDPMAQEKRIIDAQTGGNTSSDGGCGRSSKAAAQANRRIRRVLGHVTTQTNKFRKRADQRCSQGRYGSKLWIAWSESIAT